MSDGDRERFPICAENDLLPGKRRLAALDGVEVGVFNVGGRIVGYRNFCPHQGAPVCLGRVGGTTLPSDPGEYVFGRRDRVLYCPWHGWQFDLTTGEALGHRARLAPVEARVEDGEVVVYLKRRAPGRTPPA